MAGHAAGPMTVLSRISGVGWGTGQPKYDPGCLLSRMLQNSLYMAAKPSKSNTRLEGCISIGMRIYRYVYRSVHR